MTKSNESATPLLNVTELSMWLRIKESTIRKMVSFKRIPFIKIGRRVLFRKSEIEEWLSNLSWKSN